jgi:hypothetical protein
VTFLEHLMKARFPDAHVRRNPHDDNWLVTITVSGRDVMASKVDPNPLARKVLNQLDPPRKPRRRLHWGKRR